MVFWSLLSLLWIMSKVAYRAGLLSTEILVNMTDLDGRYLDITEQKVDRASETVFQIPVNQKFCLVESNHKSANHTTLLKTLVPIGLV